MQRLKNEFDVLFNLGQLDPRKWLGFTMALAGIVLAVARRNGLNRLQIQFDSDSQGEEAEAADR